MPGPGVIELKALYVNGVEINAHKYVVVDPNIQVRVDADIYNSDVGLWVGYAWDVNVLIPGESSLTMTVKPAETKRFTLYIRGKSPGTYDYTLKVGHYENGSYILDTTKTFTIIVRGKPKGSIVNVQYPDTASPGEKIEIKVKVENVGDGEGTFESRIYYGSNLLDKKQLTLSPGETKEFILNITAPSEAGTYTYKIEVGHYE